MKRIAFILVFGLLYMLGCSSHYKTNQGEQNVSTSCKDLVSQGIRYVKPSDYMKAIDYFTKAIEKDSHCVDAYIYRARCRKNWAKDYKGAIADFTKVIEIDPNNTKAYLERGNIYFDQKDYAKTVSDYNKLIEIDPNSEVGYSNRGLLFLMQDDWDKVIYNYTKAIELRPTNWYYCARGMGYFNKGDYSKAKADFLKAQLDPRSKPYLNKLKNMGY